MLFWWSLSSLFGLLLFSLFLLKLFLADLLWELSPVLFHLLLVFSSLCLKKFLIRLFLFDRELIPAFGCYFCQLNNAIVWITFSNRMLLLLEEKQKWRSWSFGFMTDNFGLFLVIVIVIEFLFFLSFLLIFVETLLDRFFGFKLLLDILFCLLNSFIGFNFFPGHHAINFLLVSIEEIAVKIFCFLLISISYSFSLISWRRD